METKAGARAHSTPSTPGRDVTVVLHVGGAEGGSWRHLHLPGPREARARTSEMAEPDP